MRSVASVKDRLKNRSKETGRSLQELFTVYGLERTIYRLSISKYVDNFTLKGGIFLYAVFDGDYARATTDIDFLAQRISNEAEDMKAVFKEIFSLEADDPLRFDLDSLNVIPITEFKKYHGVNVSIMAYLDRTRIPISIDIGFGDVVVPGKTKMDFPVLLSDEVPQVYAYSLASSVAEKFEAIVSLAYDNSRFKDYYDIYVLAHRHDFNGEELADQIPDYFYIAFAGELFSVYGWARSRLIFYPENNHAHADLESGTEGWSQAFRATCLKLKTGWLLDYYNSLPWYERDVFDGIIEQKVGKRFINEKGNNANDYYQYLLEKSNGRG